jgi:hypothetical protein
MSNYWEEVKLDALREEIKQSTDAERIRALIAEHPALTPEAATNPNTPHALLLEWAQSAPEPVKLSLIRNPSLPDECFVILANNAPKIRARALASCVRAPKEILRSMMPIATDKIRVAIAQNPNTPPDLLERLSNYAITEVYQAAQKNPNNPLYVEGTPGRRWSRDTRPQEPIDFVGMPALLIEQMTQSSSVVDRISIASFGALNPEQYQRLVQDPDIQVRQGLARRKDLSEESINLLTQEKDPGVLSRLVSNNNIPEARRRELLALLLAGDEFSRILAAQAWLLTDEEKISLANDPLTSVRATLALHSMLSVSLLDKLADDADVTVRQRAALHPRATAEIRERVMRSIGSQTLSASLEIPTTPARQTRTTPTRSSTTPSAPNKPNTKGAFRVGVGAFLLSFASLLMFSSTEEPIYMATMFVSLFLAIMIVSATQDAKTARKRGMLGIVLLVSSVVSLPLAVSLRAPIWFVLVIFYLILAGAFLLASSNVSADT